MLIPPPPDILRVAAFQCQSKLGAYDFIDHLVSVVNKIQVHIAMLSETGLKSNSLAENRLIRGLRVHGYQWLGNVGGVSNAHGAGVGLIMPLANPIIPNSVQKDQLGRGLSCRIGITVDHEQCEVQVVSIYGVSGATDENINRLRAETEATHRSWLEDVITPRTISQEPLLVGGDLNAILDANLDSLHSTSTYREESIAHSLQMSGLICALRAVHPSLTVGTHLGERGSNFLVRVLHSPHTFSSVAAGILYQEQNLTDHLPVFAT